MSIVLTKMEVNNYITFIKKNPMATIGLSHDRINLL